MAEQLNAHDAILVVLDNGKRATIDQITTRVAKKTKRTASTKSILVRISELRGRGHNITSFRGKASKARDGATQYQLVS